MASLLSGSREMSFMPPTSSWPPAASYGKALSLVQTLARTIAVTIFCATIFPIVAAPVLAADAPVRIVALGDSLTAGFGLPREEAFPARLEAALRAKGLAVEISNAGVSGDIAASGLARLDWSVPAGTDAVIVELGANDALRGLEPRLTRAALQEILRRLKERRIAVLLTGMRAPPNMGADYTRAFDAIFPELAAANDVIFYPFFLDGVAADRVLNQPDGLHPTVQGVETIVRRILPKAEELIARAKAKRDS
jgi:acyl-CoA thioesterase-1